MDSDFAGLNLFFAADELGGCWGVLVFGEGESLS